MYAILKKLVTIGMECDLENIASNCATHCYTTKAILIDAAVNVDDNGVAFMNEVGMPKGLFLALRAYLRVW